MNLLYLHTYVPKGSRWLGKMAITWQMDVHFVMWSLNQTKEIKQEKGRLEEHQGGQTA